MNNTLFVSDLDGTLLDNESRVPEFSANIINNLIARGMKFTVATGCISQGDNLEDAFRMIEEAKREWIETALEDGLIIPEPVNNEDFSGKFVVRVPKSLHKILSEQAKREGVSLNQYINYKLSKDLTYHN